MADREQQDRWARLIGEAREYYAEMVARGPSTEIAQDLSGTSAKGAPPPLPGGDRLATIAPGNMYAPEPSEPDERIPHPEVFMDKWTAYVIMQSHNPPPIGPMTSRLEWLSHRLHWIGHTKIDEFSRDLWQLRSHLARLIHLDRPSQEEEDEGQKARALQARTWLRDNADTLGDFYPLRDGQLHREPILLTREQAGIIWPQFVHIERDPATWRDVFHPPCSTTAECVGCMEWNKVATRTSRARDNGDRFRRGLHFIGTVRAVARGK